MVRALEAAGSSPPPDLLQRRTRHERATRVSPCAVASSSIACSVPESIESLALTGLTLSMRKASLSRLLAPLSDFEQGEIGPDLFRHACLMGLEGMVSKHRESLYRGGRFRHWVKIQKPRIRRSLRRLSESRSCSDAFVNSAGCGFTSARASRDAGPPAICRRPSPAPMSGGRAARCRSRA